MASEGSPGWKPDFWVPTEHWRGSRLSTLTRTSGGPKASEPRAHMWPMPVGKHSLRPRPVGKRSLWPRPAGMRSVWRRPPNLGGSMTLDLDQRTLPRAQCGTPMAGSRSMTFRKASLLSKRHTGSHVCRETTPTRTCGCKQTEVWRMTNTSRPGSSS